MRISLCRGVKPSVRLPDGLVDLFDLTALVFLAGFAALVDLVVFFAFAAFLAAGFFAVDVPITQLFPPARGWCP